MSPLGTEQTAPSAKYTCRERERQLFVPPVCYIHGYVVHYSRTDTGVSTYLTVLRGPSGTQLGLQQL